MGKSDRKEREKMSGCCWCFFSVEQSAPSNLIRVVHLNGRLEFFTPPATASHVISKQSNGNAVWTPTRLISTAPVPLKLTDKLEPGSLYYLLPRAVVFHSDASPASLTMLVKRLKAMADRAASQDIDLSQTESRSSENKPGRWTASMVRTAPMWKPELETIEELRSSIASSTFSRELNVSPAWFTRA